MMELQEYLWSISSSYVPAITSTKYMSRKLLTNQSLLEPKSIFSWSCQLNSVLKWFSFKWLSSFVIQNVHQGIQYIQQDPCGFDFRLLSKISEKRLRQHPISKHNQIRPIYSCKLRDTFVAIEKKDPCWLGSWPIQFRWKTIQIICSFIQLLTRHSTRMTTAIKTTKQKSPEACYDKEILKAKQIHSYIDFQEDKFNGEKKTTAWLPQ